MRYTQMVNFEIAPTCKYAINHTFCPANKRMGRDGNKPISDDLIVSSVKTLYDAHGFKGMIGFHYYCEPMQAAERMWSLIDKIKGAVSAPRFILWTNANEHIEKADIRIRDFSFVAMSCYDETPKEDQIKAARNIAIQCPSMWATKHEDDGRAGPARIPRLGPCMLPFLEMCVEYYGSVRMCCYDWDGETSIGNLSEIGMEAVVSRWLYVRRKLFDDGNGRLCMSREAPVTCKVCSNKCHSVSGLDKDLASEAALFAMSQLKEARCV